MYEPEAKASTDRLDYRLDEIVFKLDHKDSRFDRMESFFTVELSAIKELLTILVIVCCVCILFVFVLIN